MLIDMAYLIDAEIADRFRNKTDIFKNKEDMRSCAKVKNHLRQINMMVMLR